MREGIVKNYIIVISGSGRTGDDVPGDGERCHDPVAHRDGLDGFANLDYRPSEFVSHDEPAFDISL